MSEGEGNCANAQQSAVGTVCRTNGDKMGSTRVLVGEPAGRKEDLCLCEAVTFERA